VETKIPETFQPGLELQLGLLDLFA
jgi:hypothetical protein